MWYSSVALLPLGIQQQAFVLVEFVHSFPIVVVALFVTALV
jgi:hypothetical protein